LTKATPGAKFAMPWCSLGRAQTAAKKRGDQRVLCGIICGYGWGRFIKPLKSRWYFTFQAERYGTPMAQTLRVMAQENRDMRMSEAEKKAAALPPKLTVPMILFFLPVLFVVILGPAAIRVMETMK
jgi:hypothetical protein